MQLPGHQGSGGVHRTISCSDFRCRLDVTGASTWTVCMLEEFRYRVSSVIGPCQVELSTFSGNIAKTCEISKNSVLPDQPPDQPFRVGLRVFFVCGRLSFVVEARRCVLFDSYATQFLLEDLVYIMHVGRLLHVRSVGRSWLCSFWCNVRGSSCDRYHQHFLGKWLSTVLRNNFICGVKHWCFLLSR